MEGNAIAGDSLQATSINLLHKSRCSPLSPPPRLLSLSRVVNSHSRACAYLALFLVVVVQLVICDGHSISPVTTMNDHPPTLIYSLNSPVLDSPPLSRSSRRVSSFTPQKNITPLETRRRTATKSASTIRLVPPPVPVAVLGSPDPASAVPAQRRSVQFASGSTNWSRPMNQAPTSYRPTTMQIPTQRPGSTSSGSDDDLPLTPQTAYLPPGAAAADRWPGEKAIGLGINYDDTDTPFCTPPTTPNRLQFVSESLAPLSSPTTLEDLSRLRKAAAQLDLESQKLRRHKGRDPAAIRIVPRKAVPVPTEEELNVAPKPRRAAVRHSLIVASPAFELPPSPPRKTATPPRRGLYQMGKAAMSSIEFTRGSDSETDEMRMGRRIGSVSQVPTLGSLRGSVDFKPLDRETPAPTRASPTAPGPPVLATPPAVPSPSGSPAMLQTVPERSQSIKHKPSGSFLGKHKKLSRFLGKA